MHALGLTLRTQPTEDSSAAFEKSWIVAYGMEGYEMHRLYAVSIYVAIVAIFGGVSSVSPQNFFEFICLSVMMLSAPRHTRMVPRAWSPAVVTQECVLAPRCRSLPRLPAPRRAPSPTRPLSAPSAAL